MVLGLSSHYLLSTFSVFSTKFFSRFVLYYNRYLVGATPLEFSTNHFETTHSCSTLSEDVHVVLGLSSCFFFFFINFFHFFDLVFPGPISIRIDSCGCNFS